MHLAASIRHLFSRKSIDVEQSATSFSVGLALLHMATVPDSELQALLGRLGDSERARYDQFGAPRRARQFVAGRLLLRHVLSRWLSIPRSAISVVERSGQAPALQLADDFAAPHFSVSHSGDWIAVACSTQGPVGVDIELRNPERDVARLAAHTFSKADLQWWQQQVDPVQAFYRLWSLREAHYKLTQSHADVLAAYPEELCQQFDHAQLSIALVTATPLAAPIRFSAVSWSSVRAD